MICVDTSSKQNKFIRLLGKDLYLTPKLYCLFNFRYYLFELNFAKTRFKTFLTDVTLVTENNRTLNLFESWHRIR